MLELASWGAMKTRRPQAPAHNGAAGGCDGIGADPDHIAFPGDETVRVASPLNQVLLGVLSPASVQDGFQVKVV